MSSGCSSPSTRQLESEFEAETRTPEIGAGPGSPDVVVGKGLYDVPSSTHRKYPSLYQLPLKPSGVDIQF